MSAELKSSIIDLGNELADAVAPGKNFESFFPQQLTEHNTLDACYALFDCAEWLIEDSYGAGNEPPKFELTQKLMELAADSRRPGVGDYNDEACFAAELRFARSLERHLEGDPDPDYLPAAVLFDTCGQPFAYQKSDGMPTAYAWRSACFSAQKEEVWIPEEAIFSLEYEDAGDIYPGPRSRHRGKDIVALTDEEQASKVRFLRFSLKTVPEVIRRAALSSTIEKIASPINMHDSLWAVYEDACSLDASKVGMLAMTALRGVNA